MDEQTYFKERLDREIKWHNDISVSERHWYLRYKTGEIFLAASIPVLTAFATEALWIKVLMNLFAVALAFVGGVSRLWKFQENWMNYRVTCESLKREKYLYLSKVGAYNADNAFSTLVQQVEMILSKENTQWVQLVKNDNGKTQEENGHAPAAKT
ncbi:MAG: DUF4231 domain-containing protein [Anaerolineaceae bacterium]|nr:DUF4231 domain-containing protein [Anaerolineaceae bacterium]